MPGSAPRTPASAQASPAEGKSGKSSEYPGLPSTLKTDTCPSKR